MSKSNTNTRFTEYEQNVLLALELVIARGEKASGSTIQEALVEYTGIAPTPASVYSVLVRMSSRRFVTYSLCSKRDGSDPKSVAKLNQKPRRRKGESVRSFEERVVSWDHTKKAFRGVKESQRDGSDGRRKIFKLEPAGRLALASAVASKESLLLALSEASDDFEDLIMSEVVDLRKDERVKMRKYEVEGRKKKRG